MKKTLNVGCGNRTYEEYPPGHDCFNYDERENLEHVDIVGDVRDLSRYSDETFDYMLASDILEHFTFEQTEKILLEWFRVLNVGGVLELRVPSFKCILDHYKKNNNMQHVSWMIMGGQDYSGNYHYVVFDGKWLKEICGNVGFEFISCVEEVPNLVMKVKKISKSG